MWIKRDKKPIDIEPAIGVKLKTNKGLSVVTDRGCSQSLEWTIKSCSEDNSKSYVIKEPLFKKLVKEKKIIILG